MKRIQLLLFLAVGMSFILVSYRVPEMGTQAYQEVYSVPQQDAADATHGDSNDSDGEAHSTDMSPLFFVIIALFIGAATQQFLRKSPLPFTVSLLIIGLVMGAAVRLGWLGQISVGSLHLDLRFFESAVHWAGHIDPHLILYVFLPTLIFEAAFSMDVHTFKKTAVNASILAIPGIIMAMLLTGLLIMGLDIFGLAMDGWGWAMAFMFGAVVSATDPVAVVALLKDLGASKKLGTLIEGESMLNDGTAIVIFMVFFLGLTGEASGTSPIVEFIRVSVGGVLVGLVIGSLVIAWVRKVFNDALVEISVIIAAAYITFYVCERFMHVSGILGLVALGLAMASVGKTRISPEVEHFLHEFWELLAFIANTLIFIIVGVVIAQQAAFTRKNMVILLILYVGIHIIRALVIGFFYPILKKAGYGLPIKEAVVVWYGALRGAVGLALALIVAGEARIPENIRSQFLFLTAGIVTLTLLINATTIKYLVKKLGLTKISPSKALMRQDAYKYLYLSTQNALEKAKNNRSLRRANWEVVKQYLPDPIDEDMAQNVKVDTIAEYRRRVLEKEKSSYWHQFRYGLLGPSAVMGLTETIDIIIDQDGMIPLSQRQDLEESWKTKTWQELLQKIPLFSKLSRRYFFEKLSVSYDSARAFVEAQDDALKLVESMIRGLEVESIRQRHEDARILEIIEEEIKENKIHGQTFLRNLRKNYPEIYSAITTRQAIRTLLNYEKHTAERLLKNGRLENGEAQKMMADIEERMKKLMDSPPHARIPDTISLLKESFLLQDVDPRILENVLPLFQTRVFPAGEKIIREKSTGNGLYFIARGTVRISIQKDVVDFLSRGQFIGEMAGLTGETRSAEVAAESPVTALWIHGHHLKKVMTDHPVFKMRLWNIGAIRISENLLRCVKPYNQWKYEQLKTLVRKGQLLEPENYDAARYSKKLIILVSGQAAPGRPSEEDMVAPALLEHVSYNFSEDALLFIC